MGKTVDKEFCMSSWLMFRTIVDKDLCFAEGIKDFHVHPSTDRTPIHNSQELENALRQQMAIATAGGHTALALSGGIDSAILAKMMPKGSLAYSSAICQRMRFRASHCGSILGRHGPIGAHPHAA